MPPKKKTVKAEAPPQDEDVSMSDAPALEEEATSELAPRGDEIINIGELRIRILPGSSDTAASFEFKKEDHTLGNALRYIIMKNPDVEFCGYSIPHPSEELMNIRIQTYEDTAAAALAKGFQDLIDLCDVVVSKFTSAQDELINDRNSSPMSQT